MIVCLCNNVFDINFAHGLIVFASSDSGSKVRWGIMATRACAIGYSSHSEKKQRGAETKDGEVPPSKSPLLLAKNHIFYK